MKIGILGYGVVGKAVSQFGKLEYVQVSIYDPLIPEYAGETALRAAMSCDFIFVCVPTPSKGTNDILDTSIVDKCVSDYSWINISLENPGVLVIKSTVPIGYCDAANARLQALNSRMQVIFNPEFLSERSADRDFYYADELILGVDKLTGEVAKLRTLYISLNDGVENMRAYVIPYKVAEATKLVRNSFYFLKVSFFNQVHEMMQHMGIPYGEVQKIMTSSGYNPWLHSQHTNVPGHDGLLGVGGKCLHKDATNLAAQATEIGIDFSILKTAVICNHRLRPEVR